MADLLVTDGGPPRGRVHAAFRARAEWSGIPHNGLAEWDGERWNTTFSRYDEELILTLALHDDGTGPAVYAGGTSRALANRVARYRPGVGWVAVGQGLGGNENAAVYDLASFDDGRGAALYAAGHFSIPGLPGSHTLARWDGAAWSPVEPPVEALFRRLFATRFGGEASLFAGGLFDAYVLNGVGLPGGIRRFNGREWSPLGAGVQSSAAGWYIVFINAIAARAGGPSPALYVGGTFDGAGDGPANHIARWDGQRWWPLGTGVESSDYPSVSALAPVREAGQDVLYAGGTFDTAGGLHSPNFARWDGAAWSSLAAAGPPDGGVSVIAPAEDGTLYVGGGFDNLGLLASRGAARWHGASWSVLGLNRGATERVAATHVGDAFGERRLYIGGGFTGVGGAAANAIAYRDASGWHTLGEGFPDPPRSINYPSIWAIREFDDGSGPALFVAGSFGKVGAVETNNIARWDGRQWCSAGAARDEYAYGFAALDRDVGADLYAAGQFRDPSGVVRPGLARWEGTNFSLIAVCSFGAYCAAVHNDGAGVGIFVGGATNQEFVSQVAKWNGEEWQPLGDGLLRDPLQQVGVRSLSVHDTGEGPRLWATGRFTVPGYGTASVALWDGHKWSVPGTPPPGAVYGLADFGEGPSRRLYALVVYQTFAGGWLSRWDGTSWSPTLGTFASGIPLAAAEFDDGSGPALWIGGSFQAVGGVPSWRLAKWTPCPACLADCDGSRTLDILDYLCFSDRYAAGLAYACDCDLSSGPARCDVFDFLCFQNAFAAGCP